MESNKYIIPVVVGLLIITVSVIFYLEYGKDKDIPKTPVSITPSEDKKQPYLVIEDNVMRVRLRDVDGVEGFTNVFEKMHATEYSMINPEGVDINKLCEIKTTEKCPSNCTDNTCKKYVMRTETGFTNFITDFATIIQLVKVKGEPYKQVNWAIQLVNEGIYEVRTIDSERVLYLTSENKQVLPGWGIDANVQYIPPIWWAVIYITYEILKPDDTIDFTIDRFISPTSIAGYSLYYRIVEYQKSKTGETSLDVLPPWVADMDNAGDFTCAKFKEFGQCDSEGVKGFCLKTCNARDIPIASAVGSTQQSVQTPVIADIIPNILPTDIPDLRTLGTRPLYDFPKNVYLTIDDSCSYYTDALIDYIDAHNIPVIFFIQGQFCNTNGNRKNIMINPIGTSNDGYNSLKKMVNSPNIIIGVHTWDHAPMEAQGLSLIQSAPLVASSTKQIQDSIDLINKAHRDVEKIWDPRHRYFRFPNLMNGDTWKSTPEKKNQLQNILAQKGFKAHPEFNKIVKGSDIDVDALFISDPDYGNDAKYMYINKVKAQFKTNNFQNTIKWSGIKGTILFGLHDNKNTITMIQMLQASGVNFLDPRKTSGSSVVQWTPPVSSPSPVPPSDLPVCLQLQPGGTCNFDCATYPFLKNYCSKCGQCKDMPGSTVTPTLTPTGNACYKLWVDDFNSQLSTLRAFKVIDPGFVDTDLDNSAILKGIHLTSSGGDKVVTALKTAGVENLDNALIIGDSHSNPTSAHAAWSQWYRKMSPGHTTLNNALSTHTIKMQTYHPHLTSYGKHSTINKVIIFLGTNNLRVGDTVSKSIADYDKLIQNIKDFGPAYIYLIKIPPTVNPTGGWPCNL
jgi:peptidoglycan/xylan/chitin deacetylase (PgdA/CDA1 family)